MNPNNLQTANLDLISTNHINEEVPKKYWDLNLNKTNEENPTSACTISIPDDDDTNYTINAAFPNQYMVHIHGFHHTGTGFTRLMVHKALSSLTPELSSSVHNSGFAPQEEGQHLQTIYPTAGQRYKECKKVKSFPSEGYSWRMNYLYLDWCKVDSPGKVGRALYNQWAPFWNTSALFLVQKTPTLDVQFLETIKVMPTLHILVIRHPMSSGIIDPHSTQDGCGGFAFKRSLDISYWIEDWSHTFSVLRNKGIWYAVLTYEALVQYTDQVMSDLIEVVKQGLKRYGGGHLFGTDYSKISHDLHRRLMYRNKLSEAASYLSPKKVAITNWNQCLKLSRCSAVLKQLTLDVLPQESSYKFCLVLLCVQYEDSAIWLLHLVFFSLYLTAFTHHALT